MTPRQDPYRALGLVPGATAGEIRSAYRRLAKLNHPDTAGERSLPRFLAIKAAYEELLDGDGRLRSREWPGRGGGAGAWRPSASTANRASREAWRARRAGGPAAGAAGSGAAGETGSKGAGSTSDKAKADQGAKGDGGAKAGAGPKADRGARSRASTGPGAKKGSASSEGGGRSRERRTARPGSTTYDEAAQPLDPAWEGGAWYGASSGSYWTLNPREYADPRKHGPEYQERARRAAQLEAERRAARAQPPDPADERPPSGWVSWPPEAPGGPAAAPPPDPLPRHRRAARHPSGPDGT